MVVISVKRRKKKSKKIKERKGTKKKVSCKIIYSIKISVAYILLPFVTAWT